MKTNFKLIAIDLDGTLLNSKSQVSREDLDAIANLADSGIKTALITGRTLYEIPLELRICKGVEYIIYSNGAGINHYEKGLRYYSPIDKGTVTQVFNDLRRYSCFIELYSNGIPYVDSDSFNDEMLNFYNIDSAFVPVMQQTRFPIGNMENLLCDEAYKIEMFDVFFKYQNQRKECIKLFASKYPQLEITASMTNNLEILNAGVNKGTGLQKLCKIEKLNLDNIIVIGDSKNDISAFETASTKYAVSNACKELKSLADKIICSNDENVMAYMEKELL